jgi:hypothetical protein
LQTPSSSPPRCDALAIQNEPALHFGDHPQHGHEDAAGIGRRAELGPQDPQTGALLFKIIDQIEHVAGIGRADQA